MITDQQLEEAMAQRESGSYSMRPISPGLESILHKPFAMLDHGMIRVVDYMGNDTSVVQAARVSYGKGTKSVREDQGIINYLMRHHHTTPFEMCLAGETRIQSYPGRRVSVKHYSIKEIAERFEKGGRRLSGLKQLNIRTVDPNSGLVSRTRIKRAWKTGLKRVFEVTTETTRRKIKATNNHPFLCDDGIYRTLKDLKVGDSIYLNGLPATPQETVQRILQLRHKQASLISIKLETGIPTSTIYKICKANGLGEKVARKTGFLKKAIGEHKNPRRFARKVIPVLGKCHLCHQKACDRHHIDREPTNNSPSNLVALCAKHHRHIHQYSVLQKTISDKICSIREVGFEEVFDLEVEHDNHNFVAEGFVVHNCEIKLHVKCPIFVMRQWIRHRTANVNEESARYSILSREFYTPLSDDIAPQSTTNRQGRASSGFDSEEKQALADSIGEAQERSFDTYMDLLNEEGALNYSGGRQGLARELARIPLPLGTYTSFYWKTDLHNYMNFLRLRCDPHAQKEIRVYADKMLEFLDVWVPMVARAFRAYVLGSYTLSSAEIEIIANSLDREALLRETDNSSLMSRERSELMQAFKRTK